MKSEQKQKQEKNQLEEKGDKHFLLFIVFT